MLRRILAFVGVAVMCASLAGAQAAPAGHWEGNCSMGGDSHVLALDLARNAKGDWIASMGLPVENMTGLVVQEVVVTSTAVTFVAVELMMARFDLTLAPGGTLKGGFSNPGGTGSCELKRTGDAHVELMPPSPAVSKELEGDWEGTLAPGGGEGLRILVRFKNRTDGTVEATFANLSMGQGSVPINDVRQNGSQVEFGLKVGHGSFQGTLSKDSTVLEGRLTHEESQVMPLTLRKK